MKNEKTIFSNKYIALKEKTVRTGNKNLKYYLVEKPDYVAIAPIYKDKILLITQHRYGPDKNIKNIPMGLIKKGEDLYQAAKRELFEETGISVATNNLKYLSSFYIAPSFTKIKGHLFHAECKNNILKPNFKVDEKHEVVNMQWVPINKIKKTDEIDLTTQLAITIISSKSINKG